MTAPYLTDEERERQRLLDQQQQEDAAGDSGAPGGSSQAPGSAGASPSVGGQAPRRPTGTPLATSSSIPSGFVPPPPPPPPPPPDLSALTAQTTQFASDWMKTPNRYGTDYANAARTASEANLTKSQEDAQRGIEEWAQGRGLIGSSYEGDQRVQLAGTMQRARNDFEAQLLEQLATADAMDRQGAGQMGLETIRAEDVMGLDRYQAELDAWNAGEAQRQFGGTQEIAQQNIDLRAQELQQQAQLEGRSLDLQAARDQAARELNLGQLGISQQEVDLRAQALVQQAQTEGRTLDLQQARQEAETALAREQMVQQKEMQSAEFGQQTTTQTAQQAFAAAQAELDRAQQVALTDKSAAATAALQAAQQAFQAAQAGLDREQQQSQFATTTGQNQQEIDLRAQQLVQEAAAQNRTLDLQAARDQATKEYQTASLAEESAGRLQQNTQWSAALQSENARAAVDAGLRSRALDLQATGMSQDEAFRRASLEQEAALTTAAQQLQATGMAQEDAYRYAALGQDATLQTKAQELTALGLNQADAFRFAELAQSDKFQTEAQRLEAQGLDQEAAYREADISLRTEQMVTQAALEGRTLDLQQARDEVAADEFTKQYGEQVASRLQQDAQWATTLRSEDARAAVDAGIRQQALMLQQQGMTMDEAYRRAALQQEGMLTTSAQQLQREGMQADTAYRYAALMQDERFKTEANNLTRMGLSQEDAYRYAEIAYRDRALTAQQDQAARDLEFRTWLAEQELGINSPAAMGEDNGGAYDRSGFVDGFPASGGKYIVWDGNGANTQAELARQSAANVRPIRLYGEPEAFYVNRVGAWAKQQGTTTPPGTPPPVTPPPVTQPPVTQPPVVQPPPVIEPPPVVQPPPPPAGGPTPQPPVNQQVAPLSPEGIAQQQAMQEWLQQGDGMTGATPTAPTGNITPPATAVTAATNWLASNPAYGTKPVSWTLEADGKTVNVVTDNGQTVRFGFGSGVLSGINAPTA